VRALLSTTIAAAGGSPASHTAAKPSTAGYALWQATPLLSMPPVAPMLAKPVPDMPEGRWSFEPKWDGFRTIVFCHGDEVELGSRKERPMTRYFPEVVEAVRTGLPPR
jgi:ATP-dependent DNA ligase